MAALRNCPFVNRNVENIPCYIKVSSELYKSEIPILAVLSFEKRDNWTGPLVRSAECKTVPGATEFLLLCERRAGK